jgi:hypothetical protein
VIGLKQAYRSPMKHSYENITLLQNLEFIFANSKTEVFKIFYLSYLD